MSKNEPKFSLDERVFCHHLEDQIYEAKVTKCEYWNSVDGHPAGYYYFLHYVGWNKKFDEWVLEDRIEKHSQDLLAKSSNKKRKENLKGKEAAEETVHEVKIHLPDSLKRDLVDDFEYITKEQKLTILPAKLTVDDLLENFRKHLIEINFDEDIDKLEAAVSGLKMYFDRSLGILLLYKFERQQFQLLPKSPQKSACYGPIHLLRLVTKIPVLLSSSGLKQDTVAYITDMIKHLVEFLDDGEYFSEEDYEYAAPEYISQAKLF